MPARAFDFCLYPADLFFRYLDGIKFLLANGHGACAEFANRIMNAGKLFRVIFNQKPGAEIAAGFFVTENR